MNILEDPWTLYSKSLVDNAERIALVAGQNDITYSDLDTAAGRLARKIADITPAQSGVVVLLGMLPEFIAVDLAILRANMIKVPLNPMLSASEMAHIVEHSRSTVLLTSSDLASDHAEKVAAMVHANSELEVIEVSLAELLDDDRDPSVAAPAAPTDRAAVYYTGGTTGLPKGVVHSRRSVATNIIAHVLEAEITSSDTLLLSTSLSHSAGSFAAAGLVRGAKTVLMDKFTPESFCDTARRTATTFAMIVPTMLYRLLDHYAAGGQLLHLKTLVYGSAPVTPSRLEEAISAFGPILIQLFGQTECPNWGTALTKRDHELGLTDPTILSSCGKRSLFADVQVLDDAGHPVEAGQTGEICLSAPFTMDEYLDNPEATAETLINGWIHTGDIGQWDERGYLYVKDRKKDMIISGGYNVYSSEVEAEIQKIPGVAQVAVIGVPDKDWGEAVCAVVVPGEGAELTQEAIIGQARDLLGSYKRPKRVHFQDSIPLTPFGKADKKMLRAPHWSEEARKV